VDDVHEIAGAVNGERFLENVEARYLLVDFLRQRLRLMGTHVGCSHGACGACTVLVDGQPMRSCLMFAVQANGAEITTIEGLSDGEHLSPLQEEFRSHHALQCGYCTPGMLVSATALLSENPRPTEDEIREYMAGNLCRCTGYKAIVTAIEAASRHKA
jgi:aerobic-type carbon monoxide dehydrogenase small subunit (CoxS/CutS family)